MPVHLRLSSSAGGFRLFAMAATLRSLLMPCPGRHVTAPRDVCYCAVSLPLPYSLPHPIISYDTGPQMYRRQSHTAFVPLFFYTRTNLAPQLVRLETIQALSRRRLCVLSDLPGARTSRNGSLRSSYECRSSPVFQPWPIPAFGLIHGCSFEEYFYNVPQTCTFPIRFVRKSTRDDL